MSDKSHRITVPLGPPDSERNEAELGPARARGSSVGRFILLDELGAGGMGVVYAGYDPDLDRKVAIKLVQRMTTRDDAGLHGRLVQEARALAKLAHPNVVSVYDVGISGHDIYIAMEYVQGQTLSTWLASSPRTPEAIRAVFVQAGRGLAAGHHAGVIHRDFKPDNVVVGEDDRVRVIDFGIAALGSELDDATGDAPPAALRLTQTGAVIGTPRYMAPEQHRAERVTPAADQFAFCVALYEAMCGEPPFPGRTVYEIEDEIAKGPPAPPPGVSAQVVSVVLRGLNVDPTKRFSSMDELLAELSYEPPRRLRRLLAPAVALTASALAITLLFARSKNSADGPSCEIDPLQLANVWDASHRSAVRSAFATARGAYGTQAFERTAAALDRYTGEWLRMRADTCAATHQRGEQSSELLDLRMQCLDGLRTEVRALVTALGERPTETSIAWALPAVSELRPVALCADVAALRQAVPLPVEPARRAALEQLTERVARVEALHRTGRTREALPLAESATAETAKLSYAPLLARALLVRAAIESASGLHSRAEQTLREAALRAAEAKDDRQAAESLIATVAIVGYERRETVRGLSLAAAAEIVVARAGGQLDLRARLEDARGLTLLAGRRYRAALSAFESARKLYGRSAGPRSLSAAMAASNAAIAASELGHESRAREVLEDALRVQQNAFGPHHPKLVGTLNTLAIIYARVGETSRAIASLRRALDILQRTHGKTHPHTASVLINLAETFRSQRTPENYGRALELYQRALAIRQRLFGDTDPRTADALARVGSGLYVMKRFAESKRHLERALALLERAFGKSHSNLSYVLNELGTLANRQGDHAAALAHCRRAYAIDEESGRASNPDDAYLLTCLGYALVGLNKHADALAHLERAHVLVGPQRKGYKTASPELLANLELSLARARWHTRPGVNVEQVRALAKRARSRYLAQRDNRARAADAWLRSLPR